MQVHTKRRRIRHQVNNMKFKTDDHDKPIHWAEAFKDVYGDISQGSITLRGYRNRENLTQEALGEILKIPQTSISKMENGKRSIGKKMARKFAEFFKTDFRVFL